MILARTPYIEMFNNVGKYGVQVHIDISRCQSLKIIYFTTKTRFVYYTLSADFMITNIKHNSRFYICS